MTTLKKLQQVLYKMDYYNLSHGFVDDNLVFFESRPVHCEKPLVVNRAYILYMIEKS